MPPDRTPHVGKLLEFNTSCAPVFVQRAALVALQQTESITPRIVAHLKTCRDTLVPLLQTVPGVQTSAAPGGMYAFLRVAGHDDSLQLAKRLGRVNTNGDRGDCIGQSRAWRSRPHNSPLLSTACPSSVATSA